MNKIWPITLLLRIIKKDFKSIAKFQNFVAHKGSFYSSKKELGRNLNRGFNYIQRVKKVPRVIFTKFQIPNLLKKSVTFSTRQRILKTNGKNFKFFTAAFFAIDRSAQSKTLFSKGAITEILKFSCHVASVWYLSKLYFFIGIL